jgi:hypothetical protein
MKLNTSSLGIKLSRQESRQITGGQNPACWQECGTAFWRDCTNNTVTHYGHVSHVNDCGEAEMQRFCSAACSNDPQLIY